MATMCKLYIPWIRDRLKLAQIRVRPKHYEHYKDSEWRDLYEDKIQKFLFIIDVWNRCGPFTGMGQSASGFNYVEVFIYELDWFLYFTDPKIKSVEEPEDQSIRA